MNQLLTSQVREKRATLHQWVSSLLSHSLPRRRIKATTVATLTNISALLAFIATMIMGIADGEAESEDSEGGWCRCCSRWRSCGRARLVVQMLQQVAQLQPHARSRSHTVAQRSRNRSCTMRLNAQVSSNKRYCIHAQLPKRHTTPVKLPKAKNATAVTAKASSPLFFLSRGATA